HARAARELRHLVAEVVAVVLQQAVGGAAADGRLLMRLSKHYSEISHHIAIAQSDILVFW
ncbi:jg22238, partial [Pararge aegeria aegeria]